jgi:restriction endonuclease S subunit
LRPLPVPAPSIREQEIIAEIYENIDHSLATSEIEVGKHRQQKHGLMHDLLTGCVKIVV